MLGHMFLIDNISMTTKIQLDFADLKYKTEIARIVYELVWKRENMGSK